MVTSKAATVAQYLAQSDAARRPALVAFRKLVKQAAPKAVESMLYGMPTYSIGDSFVAFNAQKNYLSFYVGATEILAQHRAELRGLDCGRSCLRAPALERFPLPVLAKMVRAVAARGRSAKARAKAK